MSPVVQTVLALAFAAITAVAGFMLGRRRKGVEMPPNPVFPERQKPTTVIVHEREKNQSAATVEAAAKHDVDPAVIDDGLDWLFADDL